MAIEIPASGTPRDVRTTINYQARNPDEPPYMYTYDPGNGKPKTNCVDETTEVVIHDLRGDVESKSLDGNGFQFMKVPSQEKEFVDDAKIREVYYPEVEELIKKASGGKRTYVFDHTVRRDGVAGSRGPAKRAHVDQTTEAAITRVRRHLGDDADRLLQSRVRIINAWRPIANPIAHWPLACCDYTTVDPANDLLNTKHIYPDRVGSNFGLASNPNHKWYFLSDLTPDEVILIKCYDSKEDVARLTPHTAFEDVSSPGEAPKRQSIEVRCLVFDDE